MKIEAWRKKKKMSREALAAALRNGQWKVSRVSVWQWERGKHKPNPDLARKLIDLANGDIAWGDIY